MSKVTIYDVADKANVSLATVSRVLNEPTKVKEATRIKVQEVIDELGYIPNEIARGLARSKSTTVAVVVKEIARQSVSETLSGLIEIAEMYDYAVKVFYIGENKTMEETIRKALASQIDGMVILESQKNEELTKVISKIKESYKIPIVLTGYDPYYNELPNVTIDYEQATYEATTKLIEAGRKRIIFLSTKTEYAANKAKENGYTKALEEKSLTPVIVRTTGDPIKNQLVFDEDDILSSADGIIGVRDSIAIIALNKLFEAGKSVPEDVSVIGLQGTKFSLLSRPKLTCLTMPIYGIGAVSMRLLTKLMNEEEVLENNIRLPYNIIDRETV